MSESESESESVLCLPINEMEVTNNSVISFTSDWNVSPR